jgi:hypothetical protein|tara:strand:+ start:6931 stop:7485 length:555 start_codon:yes stop_codon:yes gene_type:complete
MKHYLFLAILLGLFVACDKTTDPFLITTNSAGLLTDSTMIRELKTVFINDSLSRFIGGDEFTGNTNTISVYEKESGALLLELDPNTALDSLSTIRTVRIMDPRFKNQDGINTLSTFGDLNSNYSISSIQNTLRSLIISVDEINAYFTISKKELPEEMRYNMNKKIEAISIPESAKIKGFYLQWY